MTTEREMFDELERQWIMEGRRDSLAVLMDWLESRGVVGEMKMQRLADLELLRAGEVHGYGQHSFRDVATFVDEAVQKRIEELESMQKRIEELESSPARRHPTYQKRITAALRLCRQPWIGYRVLMSMAAQIPSIEKRTVEAGINMAADRNYVSVDFTCLLGFPGSRQSLTGVIDKHYEAIGIRTELKFMKVDEATGRNMWMPAYVAPVLDRGLPKSKLNRIKYIAWPNRYEKSYQPMLFAGVSDLVPGPQNFV